MLGHVFLSGLLINMTMSFVVMLGHIQYIIYISKQIVTGLEGNIGRSVCPERFRIASPKETPWEAILNLKGQIDSLLSSRPVIINL